MMQPKCWLSSVALAAALILFAVPRAALAKGTLDGSPSGWYVGGSLGGVFAGGLSDRTASVGANGTTAAVTQGFSLGSGFSGAAQAGYQFGRFRLEGEFLWQNFDRNGSVFTATVPGTAPSTVSVAGTSVDTYSTFLNGYYGFPTGSRFTPYLGAGVGVTWIDAAVRSAAGGVERTPGISQSALAYQAKLGLSYRLSAAVSTFLQYRFTGTAGFHYGGARIRAGGQTFDIAPATGSLSNHAVELGVRWRL